jgi:hypothetical protein
MHYKPFCFHPNDVKACRRIEWVQFGEPKILLVKVVAAVSRPIGLERVEEDNVALLHKLDLQLRMYIREAAVGNISINARAVRFRSGKFLSLGT